MYTAAVLDEPSASFLRSFSEENLGDLSKFVFLTNQGQRLPHHMTVNLGPFHIDLNPGLSLGDTVILRVDKLARNDRIGVCAACVEAAVCDSKPLRSTNRHPHVTVCIMPWSRPKDSNKIFDLSDTVWEFRTCELEAVLTEVK